jgi:hypothetical protein
MKSLLVLLVATALFFFLIPVFAQAPPVESSVSVTVTLPEEVPPVLLPPGGISFIPAKIIFEGRAYPNAFLTLLKNNSVVATFFAEPSGLFKKELTGIRGGTYTFGIFAEDTAGRESTTLSFTIGILAGTVTHISGIFISPTIDLFPSQIERGSGIDIFGQVFPGSQVNIFIFPEEILRETFADSQGKWFYELDTSPLREREYSVRAKAFFGEGEQSPFSQTIPFLIITPKCQGADLNFDGLVDIVDFSILMYFWHLTSPENICADINQDGIVDLVDFSIMMYQWTG